MQSSFFNVCLICRNVLFYINFGILVSFLDIFPEVKGLISLRSESSDLWNEIPMRVGPLSLDWRNELSFSRP